MKFYILSADSDRFNDYAQDLINEGWVPKGTFQAIKSDSKYDFHLFQAFEKPENSPAAEAAWQKYRALVDLE